MKDLNPVDYSRVSDELWDKTLGELNKPENLSRYDSYTKTCMIHLIDSVSRGYISPMEAWDAVRLGYVPENLKTRDSAYMHLI